MGDPLGGCGERREAAGKHNKGEPGDNNGAAAAATATGHSRAAPGRRSRLAAFRRSRSVNVAGSSLQDLRSAHELGQLGGQAEAAQAKPKSAGQLKVAARRPLQQPSRNMLLLVQNQHIPQAAAATVAAHEQGADLASMAYSRRAQQQLLQLQLHSQPQHQHQHQLQRHNHQQEPTFFQHSQPQQQAFQVTYCAKTNTPDASTSAPSKHPNGAHASALLALAGLRRALRLV